MAAGIAIMGFGGGAMLAKFMIGPIVNFYYRAPDYLGTVDSLTLLTEAGRRMTDIGGQMKEVIVVGANEISSMLIPGPEGVYLVGTGTIGVAQTFFTLGVIYFVVMLIAAFSYRIPPEGWTPEGWAPPKKNVKNAMISHDHVDIDQAVKTPQFYLLWIMLCLNVTAGIGVISVAKTMVTEIFGSTLPGIVNLEFAATYVMMLSLFNMIGRFFWASTSDYIGRKNTYFIFFGLGILLYLTIPYVAQQVSTNPSVMWLVLFYGATMIIFTMYGGGFATIPAYLADIFGTKFVGGIHGRLLTAWSTAGVLGPLAITSLRENAVTKAIRDLVYQIDPVVFQNTFGAGVEQLEKLMDTKTVTIAKLLEIAPEGTINPTSSLYNQTMYLMAGFLFIALIANVLMRPVSSKHHMSEEELANLLTDPKKVLT
jgi:uncharacterized membrane protein YtjA (UPF0391 family)